MNIFLVDYENTKDLTGIDSLSQDDYVAIFYSKNSNTLTFETSTKIKNSKAKIDYINVQVGGKNALDFQLATYLGYLIKENSNNKSVNFFIVSKDNGYTFVTTFWKMKKIKIYLVANLEKQSQSENKQEIEKLIKDLIINSDIKNDLTDKEIREILNIINQYKTINAINSNLIKYLKDSTLAGKILKIIKPKLKTQLNKK